MLSHFRLPQLSAQAERLFIVLPEGNVSPKGRARNRLPVAAKIAFATAGATGGTPGSPIPLGGAIEGTMCTSTCGMSEMRNGS